jgi:hypothetical protein
MSTFDRSYAAGAKLVSLGRENDFGTTFLVPFVLFAVLAPGFLLSIPPTAPVDEAEGKAKLFRSGRVTVANTMVHAVVFSILLWLVRIMVLRYFKKE